MKERLERDKARLLRSIKKNSETGCWEWQKTCTSSGYGNMAIGSTLDNTATCISAHRYSYMLFVGEIPQGLFVLHKCDNKKCVNPDHLWLGTDKDNSQDREKKGRGKVPRLRGEKNPTAKLNWETVNEVRRNYAAGMSRRMLANAYNVSNTCITQIVTMQAWIRP